MKPIPIAFTLCFLTRSDQVLLLKRNKSPNKGCWNGVGGHIEKGESPYEGCLREALEETGYRIEQARFGGILTWQGFEIQDGGLYIFTAETPPDHGQIMDIEGRLAWKPMDFLFHSAHVVSNLHLTAPHIFNNSPAKQYHFEYHKGQMKRHIVHPLPSWVDIHTPY
ncbi:MAG: NUDIX domain-containing protein [Anaerolineaceae bacterium]|nr:NUDIX domain-containing protein [Anaerolineaceae bacterium]